MCYLRVVMFPLLFLVSQILETAVTCYLNCLSDKMQNNLIFDVHVAPTSEEQLPNSGKGTIQGAH